MPGATAWDFVVGKARPEAVDAFLAKHAPPVLDPFCGGGSIPLEAQRLGLSAHGSDLNPVAVLITKALIEIPPKFAGRPPVHPTANKRMEWAGAAGLAEDVRYYGKWMRDEAEKRIGHLYPKVKVTKAIAAHRPDLQPYVGEELTVIAWLWARTVASPNPACSGAHVPLLRSFQLSTKKGKEAWVRPEIDRKANTYRFIVGIGKPPKDFNPLKGTVKRTGGMCLFSDQAIPLDYIRDEGQAGRLGQQLIAIVADGDRGRVYLSATEVQAAVALSAKPMGYPVTDLPEKALSFRVMRYGMDKHYKLFTSRQLVALTAFSDLVQEARGLVCSDAVAAASGVSRTPKDERGLADGGAGTTAYADAVTTYLAFGVSKATDYNSTLVPWSPSRDQAKGTFARQALPMVWDFAEVNPFVGAAGDPTVSLAGIARVITDMPTGLPGQVKQVNAAVESGWPIRPVYSTDPPYYDNIGYADLSDYFYAWLRRTLISVYPNLLGTMLVPKTEELIASPYRFGGSKEKAETFFEEGLGRAFSRMRQQQQSDYPLTVYYAFKQAEDDEDDELGDGESRDNGQSARSSTGWETMLEGLLRAGFTITGTWPMRTERGVRSVSLGTNALASSIVLVCRPRLASAPTATRKEFLTVLRKELPAALRDLQGGNIAPVDLAQAAIGPGMAVFSRYAKVLEAGDKAMSVRTALGLINQALDEVLAEQEGDFDSATRWAVAWFEQHGRDEGPYGVAETLSKAKNTGVNVLTDAGLVVARGGKVRLRKREELPEDWEPTDARCPTWEVTQRLVHALDKHGEAGAAALLPSLGSRAEVARELAYRLYTVCERKKWADEALAYNGLVIAWPELLKLAQEERAAHPVQGEMFTDEEGS